MDGYRGRLYQFLFGCVITLQSVTVFAHSFAATHNRPGCLPLLLALDPSISLGEVRITNLPIQDILINEVAHIPVPEGLHPPYLLNGYVLENNAKNDQVVQFLRAQIQSAFKEYRIEPSSRWRDTPATPSQPNGFYWHYDTTRGDEVPLSDIKNASLKYFSVRVTIPENYNSYPSTVARPSEGVFAGLAIQGGRGHFTVFLTSTEHSGPILLERADGSDRGLYIFDFDAVKDH